MKSLVKAGIIGLLIVAFHTLFLVVGGEVPMRLSRNILMFFLYSLTALQVLKIKNHLHVKKTTALIIVFVFFFVVDSLMSVLEGNFFIENYDLLHHMSKGFLKSLIVVIGVFVMWQDEGKVLLLEQMKVYLKTRKPLSWFIRTVLVLLISFVIYMIIGALAYPLTGPLMEATIKIPSLFENFMIQILRGMGFIAVTLPLMALWQKSVKSLWLHLCTSYILFYPILGYSFTFNLPLELRILDGIVLSLHMIAFSLLVVKFLYKKVN